MKMPLPIEPYHQLPRFPEAAAGKLLDCLERLERLPTSLPQVSLGCSVALPRQLRQIVQTGRSVNLPLYQLLIDTAGSDHWLITYSYRCVAQDPGSRNQAEDMSEA